MKPPVFIIGSPRSGTTLLRMMITAHPQIVVPPECGFAVWWLSKYSDWSVTDCGGRRLDYFLEDLAASRKFETWRLSIDALIERIASARPASYAGLVGLVYQAYGDSLGRSFSRWGDKNNFHLHHLAELRELFPDAYFVHIVRDGRDVACSYRELHARASLSAYSPLLPTEPAEIARQWLANLKLVEEGFEKLSVSRRIVVRYEDLVAAPEVELGRICAMLGELFTEEMLNYPALNKAQSLEPLEFLAWKERTLQAPTAAHVGRYRLELTPGQTAEFERIAAVALRRYCYL